MKIFINSMLNFAFKSAVKRDKWDAVNVMVSHGMSRGMIFYKELASLRASLFLRYNTEHIFYL